MYWSKALCSCSWTLGLAWKAKAELVTTGIGQLSYIKIYVGGQNAGED